jgi:hypothetical protein
MRGIILMVRRRVSAVSNHGADSVIGASSFETLGFAKLLRMRG